MNQVRGTACDLQACALPKRSPMILLYSTLRCGPSQPKGSESVCYPLCVQGLRVDRHRHKRLCSVPELSLEETQLVLTGREDKCSLFGTDTNNY